MASSPSEEKKKPVLAYWYFRGFVQDIRILLKYLNVDYENKVYPRGHNFNDDHWLVDKFNLGLDFPNIPYWIDGDVKLSESRAILKYLARSKEPSLVPTSPLEQAKAEIVEGVVKDCQLALVRYCYVNEAPAEAVEVTLNQKFVQLAEFIGDKKFCLGEKLQWIDFYLYEVLKQFAKYKPSIFNDKPQLENYIENFENIPQLTEYLKSPELDKELCYSPKGWISF